MELNRKKWVDCDRAEFLEYLTSFAKPDKVEWTRKIINTKLNLLAIPSPQIKSIAKEIAKGDFVGFLKLNIDDYYDSIIVNGILITKIKDFDLMKNFLLSYAESAENWAVCDLLSFPVTSKNTRDWWGLANELVNNPKPYARRIGIDILFKFILNDNYIDGIFDILGGFYDEREYYVNMVNAWIVAECFVKQREKTLTFLSGGKLNDFTQNKAISKCRDSFRISADDKQMLLNYKRK